MLNRWEAGGLQLSVLVAVASMQIEVSATEVDYLRDVRPILHKHCYACHGAEKQRGGLRLDIKSEAFRGGENYEASILPGNVEGSPLIRFVADPDADLKMPPQGELTKEEIATLRAWVEAGAAWPDGVDLAVLSNKREHWSFLPLSHPERPDVINREWPRTEIDYFVLSKLEQSGLHPSPQADATDWLRRVYFNLTGLPPTPEEVSAFLREVRQTPHSSTPHAAVVERLLGSPRYGERWAQHWLDVVRYADTHGFEVNTERLNAWPYRDYVIESFQNDVPYDQFIREQIAGDACDQDAATGFLVTASVLLPAQIGKDAASKRLARQDAIDEIVTNIGQTFLGLSIGCARCHDHKFDPISQRDYYAMQAFVAGVEYADRDLRTPQAIAAREESLRLKAEAAQLIHQRNSLSLLAQSGRRRAPLNSRMNVDRFSPVPAKRLRFTIHKTNGGQAVLDEVEVFNSAGVNIALATEGTVVTSSGDNIVADQFDSRFLNDGNYGNSRSWRSARDGTSWVILEFEAEQTIEAAVWGRDRTGKYRDRLPVEYCIEIQVEGGKWKNVADFRDRMTSDENNMGEIVFSGEQQGDDIERKAKSLLKEINRIQANAKAASKRTVGFVGRFREPDIIRQLSRGDPEQPKGRIRPAVLSSLGTLEIPEETPEQQRRLTLANWIADPHNPLTARVMVNRIWQGHFGTGLVGTPSDFGHSGQAPSHPELLDWLAGEFVRSGWSVKQMHRMIALSATYQQASAIDEHRASKDSEARLLWRFPSRRLSAEEIRDSIFACSGRLNLEMGGPGFNLFNRRGGLAGFTPIETFDHQGRRRMIYAHRVRRERDAVFGAFDCPDGGQSAARRSESTTPLQALNLFNSQLMIDESHALADRITAEPDSRSQIDRAWNLVLNREPAEDERGAAERFVTLHGLPALCRALLNCNEFLFLP